MCICGWGTNIQAVKEGKLKATRMLSLGLPSQQNSPPELIMEVLQEGDSLPGPKSGFLSNTRK